MARPQKPWKAKSDIDRYDPDDDLRPRLKKKNGQQVQLMDDDKMQYLRHNMKLANLRGIDIQNGEQAWGRSIEYFQLCLDDKAQPSMAGYALAMGTTVYVLRRYMAGSMSISDDSLNAIGWSFAIMNATLEDWLMHNEGNVAGNIFLLKNHYGYKDNAELVIDDKRQIDVQSNVADLIEGAKQLMLAYKAKD